MIISIDPGINHCGLCVMDISGVPRVIEHSVVNNSRKFPLEKKPMEEKYGLRSIKVLTTLDRLEELYKKYPDVKAIAVEGPFYSAISPLAYGSLLEVVTAIKYLFTIPKDLDYRVIEPMLVKKLFTGKGMAKKALMKQFLLEYIGNKSIVGNIDMETATEHEIDAIAIGYVYKELLEKKD